MGKKSRDLFKELDATSTKAPPLIPLTSTKSQSDIKRVIKIALILKIQI